MSRHVTFPIGLSNEDNGRFSTFHSLFVNMNNQIFVKMKKLLSQVHIIFVIPTVLSIDQPVDEEAVIEG